MLCANKKYSLSVISPIVLGNLSRRILVGLKKTREIDNEVRISEKAEMKRKFNRNYKQIVRHPAKLFNILDSSLKEPDSIYQYYMGQGGVGRRF